MLRTLTKGLTTCLVGLAAALSLAAQPPAPPPAPTGPAPKRDLSGIWEPFPKFKGIGANGASSMTGDGKHEPPYTAAGKAAFLKNKPSNGTTEVGPGEENDPGHACDPLGFPRSDLFEFRTVQFFQTQDQVMMLYQYARLWRSIWTDGRKLPDDPDPRWYGYSIGHWADDYTFVVNTNGTDERTWLDNAGRPHSDELRVEETFHRLDRGHMEVSVKLDDPKFYSAPWVALDKMPLQLLPNNTDMIEMMCVPSELAEYNRRHANLGNKK